MTKTPPSDDSHGPSPARPPSRSAEARGKSRKSRKTRRGSRPEPEHRRVYPLPGTPLGAYDPRHAGLDEDETLLPESWTVQVRRVRAAARQDLRKLLDMDLEERTARIEEAESRRSFRSNALAEMLLEESRAHVATEPAQADSLAHVAWLVLHWVPGPPGELWRQTGRARALAHRANALRCAGDLAEADRMFQRLHTRVIHERLEDPRLTGEAAQWEAALRWRQGRWEEAVELLGWAVEAHRRRGARPAMAHCLVHWAEVLRGDGDGKRAVGCLDWAARVLEPAALAAQRRRVLLHRGQVLCDAGRLDEATACLEASRSSRRGESEGEDPLGLDRTWLEGRLEGLAAAGVEAQGAAGRSAAERAVARERGRSLVREARNGLLAAGRRGDAAAAALDEVAVALLPAAEGEDEGGESALAARQRTARWLEERVLSGGGLPMLLEKWVRMVAHRLVEETPAADDLAEMRRGLAREVALATWGAD